MKPIKTETNRYLEAEGVQDGEWQNCTIKQLRYFQLPKHPLKVQVMATGLIQSHNNRGQLAQWVKTDSVTKKKHRIDLTSAHIVQILFGIAVEYYSSGAHLTVTEVRSHKDRLLWQKEQVRKAIADLEAEGMVERRTKNGKVVRDLPQAEKERLSGGEVRMYFLFKPRAPQKETVEREWKSLVARETDGTEAPAETDRGSFDDPLPPSISLIEKVFKIEGLQKTAKVDSKIAEIVLDAWAAARKIFLERCNGLLASLPSTVDGEGVMERPPQGDVPKPRQGVATDGVIPNTQRNTQENTRLPASPQGLSSSSSSSATHQEAHPKQKTTTTTNTTEARGNPAPQSYASDRDELVALVKRKCGRLIDEKTFRWICEKVELRGWTLRQYLDEAQRQIATGMIVRGVGFFVDLAKKVNGPATTPVAEPETAEQKAERTGPCKKCRGIGKVDGAYCTCQMGRDLEKVEMRKAKAEVAS